MLYSCAKLIGDGLQHNNIFDLNSSGNRDGCFEPFLLLKHEFLAHGVELNTADIQQTKEIQFELHMNVQPHINSNIPCYVMLYESPQIRPSNQNNLLLAKYRRIFTWRDDLVDGKRYVKFNLPNKLINNNSMGWKGRDRLCCMIASNKAAIHSSPLLLYPERVCTIRWFEQYAPQDFDLFGYGWDFPVARQGFLGRCFGKLQRHMTKQNGIVFFPSHCGQVSRKLETMRRYRFNFCYENVRELHGYITEKIFDSFSAGCIPIYWGASNITTYIPEDCFIDRRKFLSHEELYKFMVSMTESDFIAYQERIAEFLNSDRAKPFSMDAFTKTIVTTIVSDLGVEA